MTSVEMSDAVGAHEIAGAARDDVGIAAVEVNFVMPSEEVVTKGRIAATRMLIRHRPLSARSEAKAATVTVRSGS